MPKKIYFKKIKKKIKKNKKIIGIQLIYKVVLVSAVIFLVTKVCPTLCDPMDCSASGLPVLYYLPEFQIHAH